MQNGWVKLHRQALENPVFRHDPTAWHVFEVLLLCANREGKWSGGTRQLAELCEMNRSTVYDAIRRLESEEMIDRGANRYYTVYHICNWGSYQSTRRTVTGQSPDSDRHSYKNENKNKKKKLNKKRKTEKSNNNPVENVENLRRLDEIKRRYGFK